MITRLLQIWVEKKTTILLWGAIVVLFLIGAVTVWLFFFNKGILRVAVEAPVSVEVVGVETFGCEQNPCEIELAVGSYALVISKSGYENVNSEVVIERGETSEVTPELVYSPDVTGASERWDFDLAKERPQQFQSVSFFDPVPDEALRAQSEALETDFFVWAPRGKSFYWLDRDEESLKDVLFTESVETDQTGKVTVFPRDIEDGLLAVNRSETKLALVDLGSGENGIYEVDLSNGDKKKLVEVADVRRVKWLRNDDLIVEHVVEGEVVLSLIGVESNEIVELPFMAGFENISSRGDGRILFVAGRVADLVSQNDENPGSALLNGVFLNEYNPATGEIDVRLNIQNSLRTFPEGIEISDDEKLVRILSAGVLFEVRLSL